MYICVYICGHKTVGSCWCHRLCNVTTCPGSPRNGEDAVQPAQVARRGHEP